MRSPPRRKPGGGDISRKKKLLEKQKKGNVGGSENSVGRCFPDYTDAGGR
jgi:translation elongation factor EF-4